MKEFEEFEDEDIVECDGMDMDEIAVEEISEEEGEDTTGGGWSNSYTNAGTYTGSSTSTSKTVLLSGKLATISSVTWYTKNGARCYWTAATMTIVRGTKGTVKLRAYGKKLTGKKVYVTITVTFK